MDTTEFLSKTLQTYFYSLVGNNQEGQAASEDAFLLSELDYAKTGANLEVRCGAEQLCSAAEIMNEQHFFLESISGVDWPEREKIELLYDFSRYDHPAYRVLVRCETARREALVPTISHIFPAADWHERETFDFFGVHFSEHPNLIRILLPEDADFYPLRKDYTP